MEKIIVSLRFNNVAILFHVGERMWRVGNDAYRLMQWNILLNVCTSDHAVVCLCDVTTVAW